MPEASLGLSCWQDPAMVADRTLCHTSLEGSFSISIAPQDG